MDRDTFIKFVLPILLVLIVIISILVITGLASENPDGFEWALFDWAGVSEPEGGFGGIFGFLGEGPVIDAITGAIGIIVILLLAMVFFKLTSRKSE
jgi:uncharacterized membrane protein